MAQQLEITLTDDIDGGKASTTIRFGIDGKTYEIDLNKRNSAKLYRILEPYVEKGRRVRPHTSTTVSRSSVTTAERHRYLEKVRSWARRNGHQVADRGRVPRELMDQYDAANSSV